MKKLMLAFLTITLIGVLAFPALAGGYKAKKVVRKVITQKIGGDTRPYFTVISPAGSEFRVYGIRRMITNVIAKNDAIRIK